MTRHKHFPDSKRTLQRRETDFSNNRIQSKSRKWNLLSLLRDFKLELLRTFMPIF